MNASNILRSFKISPKASNKTKNDLTRSRVVALVVLVCVFVISLVVVLILSIPSIKVTINTLSYDQQYKELEYKNSTTTTNGIILNSCLPATNFENYNQNLMEASKSFTQQMSKDTPSITQIDVTHSCYFSKKRYLCTKLDASAINNDKSIVCDSTKTLVYDIMRDKMINITDVLSNDAASYVNLSEAIVNRLQKSKDLDIKNKAIKNHIKASPDSFSNFILTDDSIHFVYAKNTLSSEEIIVSCKLDELSDEINPEFFPSNDNFASSTSLPEPTFTTVKKPDKSNKKPKIKIKQKTVALTFDDGPHYKNTKRLLKKLKKYGVKCTFFVLGRLAKANPKLVKQAYKDGHEIAIHSWSHKQYTKMKAKNVQKDIRRCKRTLAKILGAKYTPRSIRVPYGSYNDRVLKVCKKEKLAVYMWSLDTLDWKNLNKKKNIKVVTKKTRKKDIILMHDIHTPTVASIKDIIVNLSKKGYEFTTVDTLIRNPKSGKVYFSGR